MPRQPRISVGNVPYHVINRANGRQEIFCNDKDYQLFEQILEDAKELIEMRILSYCIMPNHWHLVLYPKQDRDLSEFMKWLTNTHTRKYHALHKTIGTGHLYQGRFKSFTIETDPHLLQVIRYVERNALRAKLVKRAEDWRWSSVWRRGKGTLKQKELLSRWPIKYQHDYLDWVNESENKGQLQTIRTSVNKGTPYGSDDWTLDMIEQYDLKATVRGPGRPKGK